MQCVNHEQYEASGSCVYCGKMFCQNCLVEVEGRNYCKKHVGHLVESIRKENQPPAVNGYEQQQAGITIHNTLNGTATAENKVISRKRKGIVNGYGFHMIFQLILLVIILGFGFLTAVSLLSHAFRPFVFFGFLSFVFFIMYCGDYAVCRRHPYEQ